MIAGLLHWEIVYTPWGLSCLFDAGIMLALLHRASAISYYLRFSYAWCTCTVGRRGVGECHQRSTCKFFHVDMK